MRFERRIHFIRLVNTMTTQPLHLLHLDASARPGRAGEHPHGSQTRRLTHRFVTRWRATRPQDTLAYRDIGAAPPQAVSHAWIGAAFAAPGAQEAWTQGALHESDRLVDELLRADLLVIGAPLYNFGMPSALKAWVDNVVRVGRTVDYDASDLDDPYRPLLADRPRTAVVLSSRGGAGYGAGEPLAGMNHLEASLRTALNFIGISDIREVAVEYEEYKDARFEASVAAALQRVDALVDELAAEAAVRSEALLAA